MLAFSAMSLLAARNIPLFAVVVAPILSRHASSALEAARERWPGVTMSRGAPKPLSAALHWATLAGVASAVMVQVLQPMDPDLNRRVIAESAPVGAAEYLRRHPTRGTLFNTYNLETTHAEVHLRNCSGRDGDRGNQLDGWQEFKAVLTSTRTGSWDFAEVRSRCGTSQTARCYPYSNSAGVRPYVGNSDA